jgi:putative addiction module component (TIGR02574 family)
MSEDERAELLETLSGEVLDEEEWTAAWNDELSRRMGQIERGEVELLTREEFWSDDK